MTERCPSCNEPLDDVDADAVSLNDGLAHFQCPHCDVTLEVRFEVKEVVVWEAN